MNKYSSEVLNIKVMDWIQTFQIAAMKAQRFTQEQNIYLHARKAYMDKLRFGRIKKLAQFLFRKISIVEFKFNFPIFDQIY